MVILNFTYHLSSLVHNATLYLLFQYFITEVYKSQSNTSFQDNRTGFYTVPVWHACNLPEVRSWTLHRNNWVTPELEYFRFFQKSSGTNKHLQFKRWEQKRSKCFFTYIHLDLFCTYPLSLNILVLNWLMVDISYTSVIVFWMLVNCEVIISLFVPPD